MIVVSYFCVVDHFDVHLFSSFIKTYVFFAVFALCMSCCKAEMNVPEFIIDDLSIFKQSCIEIPGLSEHQSMVFYDDDGFFIMPSKSDLVCDIYDLNTKKQKASIVLPVGDYVIPHANTVCFSNSFFSQNSSFPALYVSSWNNGRQAFVYDISYDGESLAPSLVQIIDPNNVSKEIVGEGYLDWVVDSEEEFIYSVSYHIRGTSRVSEGNFIHVAKFKLPSLQEKEIMLNDDNVVDYFAVSMITVFQDKCFNKGHIYVAAGTSDNSGLFPPRLYDIDVKSKQMKEAFLPLSGEPEGLCWYKGEKWLNMYGSNVIIKLESNSGK